MTAPREITVRIARLTIDRDALAGLRPEQFRALLGARIAARLGARIAARVGDRTGTGEETPANDPLGRLAAEIAGRIRAPGLAPGSDMPPGSAPFGARAQDRGTPPATGDER